MPAERHPHGTQPVLQRGASLDEAGLALVLLHGRYASAEDILGLHAVLDIPGLASLAPQADGGQWYPYRFIAPIEANEPYLSSALRRVDEIMADLEARGIAPERVVLGGFSQGACLAAEYVLRRPRRYAGLLVFSGGYIGPLDLVRTPQGTLDGMPVFIGCSDSDPHIPLERVHATAALLTAMGAAVDAQVYPDMGHMISADEIRRAGQLVAAAAAALPTRSTK